MQKSHALKLVTAEARPNVINISSKNNNAVIDLLKKLLDKANSGELTGLAGIFFTQESAGSYSAGNIYHKPNETTVELARLQAFLQGSHPQD